MAGIDKIYGTQKQYNELRKWLLENQKPMRCVVSITFDNKGETKQYDMVLPTRYLYPSRGYDNNYRPISNFPEKIDKWLLINCPLKFVTDRIKEQYNIG